MGRIVVEVMPKPEILDPQGKAVVAGVVSGRNIWRTDLDKALSTLEQLRERLPEGTPITVATSTSLQHVPHDVERETAIDPQIRSWLAFADQKVGEVIALSDLMIDNSGSLGDFRRRSAGLVGSLR